MFAQKHSQKICPQGQYHYGHVAPILATRALPRVDWTSNISLLSRGCAPQFKWKYAHCPGRSNHVQGRISEVDNEFNSVYSGKFRQNCPQIDRLKKSYRVSSVLSCVAWQLVHFRVIRMLSLRSLSLKTNVSHHMTERLSPVLIT